jgi:hypothetical protein
MTNPAQEMHPLRIQRRPKPAKSTIRLVEFAIAGI